MIRKDSANRVNIMKKNSIIFATALKSLRFQDHPFITGLLCFPVTGKRRFSFFRNPGQSFEHFLEYHFLLSSFKGVNEVLLWSLSEKDYL